MNKPYGRISEHVLFAVFLAAVIGWTATPVVANPLAASNHPGSLAVTTAAHHS